MAKKESAEKVIKDIRRKTRRPHYLLVRNPFRRLESFFKDKFRQHPAQVQPSSDHEWQYSQRLFFPALCLDAAGSFEAVHDRLTRFPFDAFIEFLPQVILHDGHLVPQHHARDVIAQGRSYRLRFERNLKVEAPDDRAFMQRALGLDTTIVGNSTQDVSASISWSSAAQATVRDLYAQDFSIFGYATAPG